jgi:hypothetical protein
VQVVVRGFDGLGNQLFQYAALRYYAKRYGAAMRLAVDPVWNAHCYGYPRPFLLSHFAITEPMAKRSQSDRLLITDNAWLRSPSFLWRRALRTQVFTEAIEQRYSFLRDLPLDRNIKTLYLLGYWQNYIMVEHVAGELTSVVTLKPAIRYQFKTGQRDWPKT